MEDENYYHPDCRECNTLVHTLPIIPMALAFFVGLFFVTQPLKWLLSCIIVLPIGYYATVQLNKRLPINHEEHHES